MWSRLWTTSVLDAGWTVEQTNSHCTRPADAFHSFDGAMSALRFSIDMGSYSQETCQALRPHANAQVTVVCISTFPGCAVFQRVLTACVMLHKYLQPCVVCFE
jgi:hypothetical protein